MISNNRLFEVKFLSNGKVLPSTKSAAYPDMNVVIVKEKEPFTISIRTCQTKKLYAYSVIIDNERISGTKIFARKSEFMAIRDKGVFKSIIPEHPPFIEEKDCKHLNNVTYHNIKHGLPCIKISFYNTEAYYPNPNEFNEEYEKVPLYTGKKEFHQLPSLNNTKAVTFRPLSLAAGSQMEINTGYMGTNKMKHTVDKSMIIDIYSAYYYNFDAAILANMIDTDDIRYYSCIPEDEIPGLFKILFVSLLKYTIERCMKELVSWKDLEYYFNKITGKCLEDEIREYSLGIYINTLVDEKVIIRSQLGFALDKNNENSKNISADLNEGSTMVSKDSNCIKAKKKKISDDEIIDLTQDNIFLKQ